MATVDKAVHVLRIVVQMQNFGVFVCVDKLYLSRCRPSIEESLSPAGGRAEFALAHPSPPPLSKVQHQRSGRPVVFGCCSTAMRCALLEPRTSHPQHRIAMADIERFIVFPFACVSLYTTG